MEIAEPPTDIVMLFQRSAESRSIGSRHMKPTYQDMCEICSSHVHTYISHTDPSAMERQGRYETPG